MRGLRVREHEMGQKKDRCGTDKQGGVKKRRSNEGKEYEMGKIGMAQG